MHRINKWNAAKRNACLSEFRRLIGSHRKEEVRNAMRAGRSLKQLMADARVVLVGIDDIQLERFRRRYAVPLSLKGVMFAVATGKEIFARRENAGTRQIACNTPGCRKLYEHQGPCDVVKTQAAIELPRQWGTESYLVTKERKEKEKIKTRAERKIVRKHRSGRFGRSVGGRPREFTQHDVFPNDDTPRLSHKIPATGKEVRIYNTTQKVCRICDNVTLHYQLERFGWTCSRVVSILRRRGIEVSY